MLIHITMSTQETVDSQPTAAHSFTERGSRVTVLPCVQSRTEQIVQVGLAHDSTNTITCREQGRQWSTDFLKQLQFSLSFFFKLSSISFIVAEMVILV